MTTRPSYECRQCGIIITADTDAELITAMVQHARDKHRLAKHVRAAKSGSPLPSSEHDHPHE